MHICVYANYTLTHTNTHTDEQAHERYGDVVLYAPGVRRTTIGGGRLIVKQAHFAYHGARINKIKKQSNMDKKRAQK